MASRLASDVTLKMVADAAQVSRMTVSLALRNHPSLPVATRQRIQSVAERLGYQPDPDVGKLMEKIREKKRNRLPNILAYLTAHENRLAWKDEPTQRMYHDGAFQRAHECGFELQEFWLRERGMTEARLSEIIRNRGIDGVLVAPLPTPRPIFQNFRWDYVSAVELGYSLRTPALDRACNHQFQSMMLLMHQLQEAGYRDIGLAMRLEQDERVNRNWRSAYLGSQSLLSRHRSIPILLSSEWTCAVFANWYRKYQPEVVVTIGMEVREWMDQLNIRYPKDVGLANVDLRPNMEGITGINQNSPQVGAAAMDLLISLMHSNQRGVPEIPRLVMVEGSYVQGKSTWDRVLTGRKKK